MGTSTRKTDNKLRAKIQKDYFNGEFEIGGGVQGFGAYGKSLLVNTSGKLSSEGSAVSNLVKSQKVKEVFISISNLSKKIKAGDLDFTQNTNFIRLSRGEQALILSNYLNIDQNEMFNEAFLSTFQNTDITQTLNFLFEFSSKFIANLYGELFFESLADLGDASSNDISIEMNNLVTQTWANPFNNNFDETVISDPEELIPTALDRAFDEMKKICKGDA